MATRSPTQTHAYWGVFPTINLPASANVEVGDTAFDSTMGTLVVCTAVGPVVWTAVGGGGGTIAGTIAANEVAFGTGVDTIGGSANLTWNTGTSALSIIGDAFDCLTVASVIDGQFLAVSPTAYTLVITDPLTPTSSATMGPGDVAVGDGLASGNVQAGFVGVTENATGNRLTLTAPAGLGTLTSEDSATNAPVALNVVCEELQVNGAPGAAGEVLTSNGPGVAPTWQAGGGIAAFDLSFQGENTGTSPLVIGAVYLPGTAFTTSSRVLLGVVGAGTATLRLVEQATSTVVATWTQTGALTDVALGAPTAPLTAGWYVFDLAGDVLATVTRCYGAHLE